MKYLIISPLEESSSAPVGEGEFDGVKICVNPVDYLTGDIDGDAIGPDKAGVVEDLSVAAVHSSSLYSGLNSPVSPVHVPAMEHTSQHMSSEEEKVIDFY